MGDPSPPCPQSHRAGLPVPEPTSSFWQSSFPHPIANYRTSTSLPATADVVVVGSGITSAFATRELLDLAKRDGRTVDVLVIEARTTCSGATGRNGGHAQPIVHEVSHGVVDFEVSCFEDLEGLVKWEGRDTNRVDCGWRRVDGVQGFWNGEMFEEAKMELNRRRGEGEVHVRDVEVVEDREILGKLGLRGAVGAIRQSRAATLSPYELVIGMWKEMLEAYDDGGGGVVGMNLQTTTPVTGIEHMEDGRGYVCHTPRGKVIARHVLLATNGYTSHLLPEFESLVRPLQAQMSALRPPESFKGKMLKHSYGFLGNGNKDRVMSDYLLQRPLDTGGRLMFGGARDQVAGHGEGVWDDSYVDPDAEEYLRHLLRFLDLGGDAEEKLEIDGSWTGIIGQSIDGFPWVGGVPGYEGLWVCSGYSGHGMTNAPGCGRHAARLVMEGKGGGDWRERERRAVERGEVPGEYVLSKERLDRCLKN